MEHDPEQPSTSTGRGQKRRPGEGLKGTGKGKHRKLIDKNMPNTGKRPADEQLAGKGKQQATEMDVDGEVAEITGGGGPSQMTFRIPPNYISRKSFTLEFGKVIRAWAFGLGPKIITRVITAKTSPTRPGYTQSYLTTSFAEVPVHRLEIYLTPGEYNNLPPGSRCTHVSVEVAQRNPVIQFETGASTTKEATINQVKQCNEAIGLNLTGKGMTVSVGGFAGELMLPGSIGLPKYNAIGAYKGLSRTFYGSSVSAATFNSDIPFVASGHPVLLQNYWAWTQSSLTGTGTNAGWPETTRYFKQWDGADTINTPISKYEYTPANGFLKTPLQFIQPMMPTQQLDLFGSTNNITDGQPFRMRDIMQPEINANGEISRINHNVGTVTTTAAPATIPVVNNFAANVENLPLATDFSYTSNLEKSGKYKHGSRTIHGVKTQPSYHVGIMPCPTGTTAQLEDASINTTFDDARVEFIIKTHMTVEFPIGTDYLYQTAVNVPVHSQVWSHCNIVPNNNSITHDGLYQQFGPFDDST